MNSEAISRFLGLDNTSEDMSFISEIQSEPIKAEPAPIANTNLTQSTTVQTNTITQPKVYAQSPKSLSIDKGAGKAEGTETNKEVSGYTAKQIKSYADGVSDLLKGMSTITNGFISQSNAKMKANAYEFQAQQNERAAELLYQNMRDINRAAQADANVYKAQQTAVKSAQKVAMAASGFSVGKGVYANTLATTDATTNFNVSMIMLKSMVQNAELTRKAGEYKAQAILNRSAAKTAKVEGKMGMLSGIVNGIGSFISSGANFYVGAKGIE